MVTINIDSFGHAQATAQATTAVTLADTDCGVVQNCTVTQTVTLPSTVVGYSYIIRVGAPGITVTVAPAAADKLAGNGFTATDNKAAIATSQPVGSYIAIVGDGANGWMFTKVHGTWTRAA